MAVYAKVTDKDRGMNRALRLVARAERLGGEHKGAAFRVGVQGREADEPHQGGALTVGEIASIHELGLGVEQRSWLVAWVDENMSMIEADLNRIAEAIPRRIARGQAPVAARALELLGQKYQGMIVARISANRVKPATSDETNKKKKSTTTLVDDGQLRSAITYIVESRAMKAGVL